MANSREVGGIIDWLAKAGVPHRVTATWDDPALRIHTPTSYHYRQGTDGLGLAVDFGSIPPGNTAELRRIYNAFVPVRPLLAELLGPGDAGHSDHVHVAVPKGTFLVPGGLPAVPEMPAPATAHPNPILTAFSHEAGYVLVAADGALYCFNCTYHGGLRWDGSAWVLR